MFDWLMRKLLRKNSRSAEYLAAHDKLHRPIGQVTKVDEDENGIRVEGKLYE